MDGKLDLKKQYKSLYSPSAKEVTWVDVPPLQYLAVDGAGDPNTAPAYATAIETLYALSYTLKFICKKQGTDFAVMPLEGLWWAADMNDFDTRDKSNWLWTAMILQPDFITSELLEEARTAAQKKKPHLPLSTCNLITLHEGKSAQILYFGPYAEEGPTIQRIHTTIHEAGHQLGGKHHEIYLSDARKVAPEKNKTIIRQPVA